MTAPAIVDAILGTRPTRRKRPIALAIVVGLSAHGLLAYAAWRAGPPIDAWAAALALQVHIDLERDEVAPIAAPPPPPPPIPTPPPEPVPEDSTPSPAPADATPAKAPRAPAPKARAGRVLDRGPKAPVDLTGDGFVTGDGLTYAGGSTSSTGTSSRPVERRAPATAPSPPSTPARRPPPRAEARPPRPTATDWACPWPRAADRLEINEAAAVVRVRVGVDGRPRSAEVVEDPGHGFGEAALACARAARFTPARDRDGAAVEATTPPLRVRFTR
ncbi:MAG: TonB family protein [Nannocystaceae bacterium]